MKMKKVLRLAILTTGFSGFFVQMLLLREFLIIFTGNELSIGIILTSWLISEGIGSYLSGKKSKNFISNEENFSILTTIFTIYFSFSIYLIRILKNILDISINQPVGVFQILYSSFLILFLPAFIHGALFTLSCKIYSNILDEKRKSAGYAYIYETTGTILGGVIWTFLLSINRFHSFYISFLISSLNFFTSFLVAIFLFNKDKIKIKIIKIFSIFLFLLNNYLIFTNYPEKIHKISLLKQWKGLNIINYQNSIYGNICLIENQQQYSFFLNGRHLSTIPIPDIEYIRKFVHLPLLLHPKPEKVLIISGNFEMINEVLKYETIKLIEYVEIDKTLIQIINTLPYHLTKVFKNQKVKIINEDGRFYLSKTKESYDLIFLGISEPSDLLSNRFFTKEFFNIVKNKLNEDGILVFDLFGSLSYPNQELIKLHRCIFETLNLIFKGYNASTYNVRVIPGSGSFLYLAAKNDKILWIYEISPQKQIDSIYYPDYRILHYGWFNFYLNTIKKEKIIDVNRDFKPVGVFYSIAYWNTIFAPYIRHIFKFVEKLKIGPILIFILLILLILILERKNKKTFYTIPFCIFSTGFSVMIFNLMIIFSFQVIYGYVFHLIGILTTFFMGGLIIGALLANLISKYNIKPLKIFKLTEILIIFYSILLPLFIIIFSKLSFIIHPFHFIIFIFPLLSLVSGFLAGIQFPIGNIIYLKNQDNVGKTAGILYCSDLLGGCIGGLLGCLVLFPVLGVLNSCLIVFLVKIFSLFTFIKKV